jgi:hypothetical protein
MMPSLDLTTIEVVGPKLKGRVESLRAARDGDIQLHCDDLHAGSRRLPVDG